MAQITLKNRALFINHLLFFFERKHNHSPVCFKQLSLISTSPSFAIPISSSEFVALGGVGLLFPDCQHPRSLGLDRLGQDGVSGRILATLNDSLRLCFFDCSVLILGFYFCFQQHFGLKLITSQLD